MYRELSGNLIIHQAASDDVLLHMCVKSLTEEARHGVGVLGHVHLQHIVSMTAKTQQLSQLRTQLNQLFEDFCIHLQKKNKKTLRAHLTTFCCLMRTVFTSEHLTEVIVDIIQQKHAVIQQRLCVEHTAVTPLLTSLHLL